MNTAPSAPSAPSQCPFPEWSAGLCPQPSPFQIPPPDHAGPSATPWGPSFLPAAAVRGQAGTPGKEIGGSPPGTNQELLPLHLPQSLGFTRTLDPGCSSEGRGPRTRGLAGTSRLTPGKWACLPAHLPAPWAVCPSVSAVTSRVKLLTLVPLGLDPWGLQDLCLCGPSAPSCTEQPHVGRTTSGP